MADRTTYVEWYHGLPIPWLNGANGFNEGTAIGTVLDQQVDLLKQAQKAHFPSLAPSDALPHIGSDRRLIQGPNETDDNFRIRLRTAWDDHARDGTPLELLVQLYWTGFPNAVLAQQNGLGFSLSGAPTAGQDPTSLLTITNLGVLSEDTISWNSQNGPRRIPATTPWWTIDGELANTSRFSVLFPGPLPSAFRTWAVATFSGTGSAAITWNNQFPTSDYQVMVGIPVITSGGPATVYADSTTQTQDGITIRASGLITGSVVVMAWQNGANPLADLHPADLKRLRIVIDRWRPGNMKCTGIYALARGNMMGWPVSTLGSIAILDIGEVVVFAP